MPNNYTYYGSAATSASGFTTIFTFRYNYLTVTNTGANAIFLTTDGKTAPVTTGGDGIFEIPAGQTMTIPNQLPSWYPSQTVIPTGVIQGEGANLGQGTPDQMYPLGSSLAGGKADPGTIINFIAVTGTTTFVVAAAG